MKVTKYPQSCLLLEKDGRRIVIDPGNFFAAKYGIEQLGTVEAVLYTHQHPDHFGASLVQEFTARGVKLYGNTAVGELIGPVAITVNSGQPFKAAGFEILPHDLPHCRTIELPPPQNTGYVIDDNFFHPGDGVVTSGVTVDGLAVPIAGPDISFVDAIDLAKQVKANKIIPMHYHQDAFWANPENFAQRIKFADVLVLQDGESVEL